MLTNQMQALPQRHRVQRVGPFSISFYVHGTATWTWQYHVRMITCSVQYANETIYPETTVNFHVRTCKLPCYFYSTY